MKKTAYFFLCCLYLMACENTQQARLEALKNTIVAEMDMIEGDLSLAFQLVGNPNEQILIHETDVFHAASTMKTPVMIEVYKQAALSGASLYDSILVINEFKSIADGSIYSLSPESDSEQTLYRLVGQKQVLRDIMYKMIIESSNLATNILIEKVGAANVNKTMREEIGAPYIEVLRGVEDIQAFRQGMNNTTTAYDLMVIFEKIATGQVVSQEACDDMIAILGDQKFNEIIPARLPVGIRVAHKTGSITGVQHDSGIVFLPDGRKYVLVILSRNLKDPDKAVQKMAHISELIYHYVNNLGKM
jgi:beta-lactamase class A